MRQKYIRGTPQERFWPKVEKTATCWLWLGALTNGYGVLNIDQQNRFAHRLAYEWLVRSIPDGLDLDHLCRVRSCVNPSHLEPVTRQVNLLRGETLVAAQFKRTECPNGHPYSEENTVHWRGHRSCRICSTARIRKYTYAWKKEQGYFDKP